jgi:sugar lactone lactonase YvrE
MKENSAELALDARAELGEGPVWDERDGLLLWVDIARNELHRFDPASGADETIDVGQPVGSVAVRDTGGYVLALQDGFGALAAPGAEVEPLAEVRSEDPKTRFNDGACDSAGRFWAGTYAEDEAEGAGALYCLEPDHSVRSLLDSVTISNGIDWSLDGRTMYYVDSPTQRVDAFDFDAGSGSIANRRALIEIPQEAGLPDGLTVDAEGCLWVALWGGSAVHRYRPDGSLERILRLPVSLVTSCCFGGADLEDLYITSAAYEFTPEQLAAEPQAGGVLCYRPGVRGRHPNPYRG